MINIGFKVSLNSQTKLLGATQAIEVLIKCMIPFKAISLDSSGHFFFKLALELG